MDKSLGSNLLLWGFISNYTCMAPPSTPQTTLDAYIQNVFRVLTLYRVGEGELTDIIWKSCTVLRGHPDITRNYDYTVSLCQGLLPRIEA